MTTVLRTAVPPLVSSILGYTAGQRAYTISHLVLTRAAKLLGSLLSRDGILFVLPDSSLFLFDVLTLCSIGHGSRDPKISGTAEKLATGHLQGDHSKWDLWGLMTAGSGLLRFESRVHGELRG